MSAKARLKRLALLGVRLGIKAGDPERQVASKHIRLAVEWLVAEILVQSSSRTSTCCWGGSTCRNTAGTHSA